MNELEDIKSILSLIGLLLMIGIVFISSLLMCMLACQTQILSEMRRKPDLRWYDVIENEIHTESEAHEDVPPEAS